LALAAQPKPEGALWEDQCFLAQQAAEKALKAVYQHRGLMFEFVHDLRKLGKGLEQAGLRIPQEVQEAIVLTKYAFETRYPGPFEPVTEAEYRKALSVANAVVAWAERILRTPGRPGGYPAAQEAPMSYRARPKKDRKRKK
jgi:HEPN domain-containing protein